MPAAPFFRLAAQMVQLRMRVVVQLTFVGHRQVLLQVKVMGAPAATSSAGTSSACRVSGAA